MPWSPEFREVEVEVEAAAKLELRSPIQAQEKVGARENKRINQKSRRMNHARAIKGAKLHLRPQVLVSEEPRIEFNSAISR